MSYACSMGFSSSNAASILQKISEAGATPLAFVVPGVSNNLPSSGSCLVTGASTSFYRSGNVTRTSDNMQLPPNFGNITKGIQRIEPAATNYFSQGYSLVNGAISTSAPTTQTISLPTGTFCLWAKGSPSLQVAAVAGTAAGSGWGTASNGSNVTLTITTAGTVVCTVTSGSAGDQVQLTNTNVPTSFVPTPSSTPVARFSEASDTTSNGLQMPLTQAQIDSLVGEAHNFNDSAWVADGASDPSGLMPTFSNNNRTVTSPGGTFNSIGVLRPLAGNVISPVIGVTSYEVVILVSGRTKGSASFRCGYGAGNLSTGLISTNGTFTFRGVFKGDALLRLALESSFDGSITIVSFRRVLASGQTNRGEGTLIQWVDLPWPSSIVPNGSWISVIAQFNDVVSGMVLRKDSSGNFFPRLYDGVSVASMPKTILQSGRYALISQWSAITGQMRVGLYNPATRVLTWGAWATYRGFFPIYGNGSQQRMRWGYGLTGFPLGIGPFLWLNKATDGGALTDILQETYKITS